MPQDDANPPKKIAEHEKNKKKNGGTLAEKSVGNGKHPLFVHLEPGEMACVRSE